MTQSYETAPSDLTVEQVKELVDRGEVALLDVREPDEWIAGHLEGATWIPMGDLERRYRELDPAKHWVIYCHIGGRSAQAVDYLDYLGLPHVSNMLGGIMAWTYRRYPTVSGR
jgi:rhodanese-related sulfurtransferase